MKPKRPGDEQMIEELKKDFPISMLTPDQLAVASYINKTSQLESIKYIHSIINDGLKTAKVYHELYVDDR